MFALSILAAFAALLVLAAWSGAFPPIKRNAEHDRNYAFHITMRSRSHAKFMTEPWSAVLAQELAEWLLKWLVAIILSAPFVWLLDQHQLDGTSAAVFAPLVVVLMHTWNVWPGGAKQIELVGHMVEAEAAMRMGHSRSYIAEEARRTQPAYDCFKGMTVDEVMAGMLRRRWLAKLLLAVVWRRARTG